jgi:hypothetical protein
MRLLAPLLCLANASVALRPRQSSNIQNITVDESSIRVSGCACPSGTDIVVGHEKNTVTFGLNSAVIAIGSGRRDLSCSITMNIDYSDGCNATADLKATYLGFAEAKNGASASIQTWYTLSTGGHLYPGVESFQGAPWDRGSDLKKEDIVSDVAAVNPRQVRMFAVFKIRVADNGRPDAVATMAIDHVTLTIVM